MNVMVTELYDALMSAGANEEKARQAATTLATSDAEFKKQFADLREDNQKIRTEIAALRGELKGEIASLRGELKNDFASLRGELNGEIASLRDELKGENASLRGELKSDFSSLRGELNGEIASLRGELTLVKWMMGVLIALAVAIFARTLFL
ncbi:MULTISPECIES: hypothetical protein [unclassified Roseitalea]|uniref:hypothetical protein n=1 Tax=unclassified Roseitalea TaxID=2639107 RepID=UPI00273EA347|nr:MULTISPECIES: hypothetical protein [unclassified Roseitalea]